PLRIAFAAVDIGEQPIKGGNWMYAAKLDGEGADMYDAADGILLHIDLAKGNRRLGGSALAQAFDQIGNDCPDIDDVLIAHSVGLHLLVVSAMQIRGLFTMNLVVLSAGLPVDGSAHGEGRAFFPDENVLATVNQSNELLSTSLPCFVASFLFSKHYDFAGKLPFKTFTSGKEMSG
ncbi:hypothetical protein ACJX0J_010014, partial [Zea mays]